MSNTIISTIDITIFHYTTWVGKDKIKRALNDINQSFDDIFSVVLHRDYVKCRMCGERLYISDERFKEDGYETVKCWICEEHTYSEPSMIRPNNCIVVINCSQDTIQILQDRIENITIYSFTTNEKLRGRKAIIKHVNKYLRD